MARIRGGLFGKFFGMLTTSIFRLIINALLAPFRMGRRR